MTAQSSKSHTSIAPKIARMDRAKFVDTFFFYYEGQEYLLEIPTPSVLRVLRGLRNDPTIKQFVLAANLNMTQEYVSDCFGKLSDMWIYHIMGRRIYYKDRNKFLLQILEVLEDILDENRKY